MNKIFLRFLAIIGSSLLVACNQPNQNTASDNLPETTERIISIGGGITGTIVDLGMGNQLVGRDATSAYPEWVKDSIESLGPPQSISIESVMKLNPTLLLAMEDDLSMDLKQKLAESGIRTKYFKETPTVEGAKELIRQVAQTIGSDKAPELVQQIDNDLAQLIPLKNKPKVLFIYARGAGTMMVAGENTAIQSMIEIAGGINAAVGIQNFQPLTTEALINSNPDVLLLFDSGLESLGGAEGLWATPGVPQTNAGKNKAVIHMDGGLLYGFNTRLGEAAITLNKLLEEYAK